MAGAAAEEMKFQTGEELITYIKKILMNDLP